MSMSKNGESPTSGQIIAWTILGSALGIITTSTYWVFTSISEVRKDLGVVETITNRNKEDIRTIFEQLNDQKD